MNNVTTLHTDYIVSRLKPRGLKLFICPKWNKLNYQVGRNVSILEPPKVKCVVPGIARDMYYCSSNSKFSSFSSHSHGQRWWWRCRNEYSMHLYSLDQLTLTRILDILILQDKTLSCACVDNFKQNGGFWCHCACADNFKQNGGFWRQHLPIVRVWTWPKYNKHHHDWKNQLCRFIDMYIGKIFWPTAPCRGCPEKEIWGQG